MMIGIIDYGMGNLRSVEKGFLKVGINAHIINKPKDIDEAKAIVLPGVGAFKDCMKNLESLSLLQPILRSIQKGKPYLGICLGLQILFTESEEFGRHEGLNVFKGKVLRFQTNLKVPHMGWNTVKLVKNVPIFDGINDESFFYFVHSYYVSPEDKNIISGITEYGISFTSMIWKDNIIATQFHPEKSQKVGLILLKNFGELVTKNS
jgi:glutamine amidotransferase